METGIEWVEPEIKPGRKLKHVKYTIPNFYIAQILQHGGEAMASLIESRANNTYTEVPPETAESFWAYVALIDLEITKAETHRNAPIGTYEQLRTIGIISVNEVVLIPNKKIKRTAEQLLDFLNVTASVDSVGEQRWISDASLAKIKGALAVVKDIAIEFLGTGKLENGTYSTGIVLPTPPFGKLVPDLDADTMTLGEPSSEMPPPPLKDVPDQPSLATVTSGNS